VADLCTKTLKLAGITAPKFMSKKERAWSNYLRNRSEKTLSELLSAYAETIKSIAFGNWGWSKDQDDLQQVGKVAVWQAAKSLDLKKVKSADAFVSLVIRRKMSNYMALMQHRTKPLDERIVKTEIENNPFSYTPDNLQNITDSLKILPEKEKTVMFLRYVAGWELKEIGNYLGCSAPNCVYIEKQAIKKLKLQQ
jgi:RNA polymerase sigma factor (sigma-70 family)